jgi:hypothetical protein
MTIIGALRNGRALSRDRGIIAGNREQHTPHFVIPSPRQGARPGMTDEFELALSHRGRNKKAASAMAFHRASMDNIAFLRYR